MKKGILILLSFFLFISCSQNKVEDLLITKADEYWIENDEYYQTTWRCYAYQFYQNGTYSFFVIRRNKKQVHPYDGGDLVYDFTNWTLSKDSILNFEERDRKIILINDSVMNVITSKGDSIEYFKLNFSDYTKMKNGLN